MKYNNCSTDTARATTCDTDTAFAAIASAKHSNILSSKHRGLQRSAAEAVACKLTEDIINNQFEQLTNRFNFVISRKKKTTTN